MKEIIDFLFGWLTKPELLQTPLDSFIFIIEFFVILPLGIAVIYCIKETIKEWRERRNKTTR